MLSWVVARLPAGLIQWIGRLQWKIPLLGPVIGWFSVKVLAKDGVIRHGVGAGLKFDARGGLAGYLFGTSNPLEQAALAEYLAPGAVFYDIGANVGFFATLAARLVGGSGQIYAFEPDPQSAKQVKKNATLNGFANVEVVEAAVSNSSGRTTLQLDDAKVLNTIMHERSGRGIDVAMTSVDDFIQQRSARAPTLVMIDTEGAEILVLEGMKETIARHRPVILCEVHWIGEKFLHYCNNQLVPLGYSMKHLEGGEFPTVPICFHVLLCPEKAK